MLASMKQGIGFIRSQSAMEALIVLAFCMTALGVPMMTFLPVFAKDVFHQGPGMFTLFLSVSGIGSIVRRAHRGRAGQHAPQRADRAHHADLPGRRHLPDSRFPPRSG